MTLKEIRNQIQHYQDLEDEELRRIKAISKGGLFIEGTPGIEIQVVPSMDTYILKIYDTSLNTEIAVITAKEVLQDLIAFLKGVEERL